MAQNGISLTAFGGLVDQGEPWIIDSGASDHMIGCEKLFSSYTPSPGNHRVKIADGTYSIVARICTIIVGNSETMIGKLSLYGCRIRV